MSNLVSAEEVKAIAKTALTDTELDAIISRVEGEIIGLIGEPQTDGYDVSLSETYSLNYGLSIFLKRPIYSVTSITDEDGVVVDSDNYRFFASQGRIEGKAGFTFNGVFTVVYKPETQTHLWKRVIIELVRLDINRSAVANMQIAGEWSFTAPDWKKERQKLMRELRFQAI